MNAGPAVGVESWASVHAEQRRHFAGHGVAWVDDLRASGLEHFKSVGFPTPRDEAWKYTNVAPVARRALASVSAIDPTRLQKAIDAASKGLESCQLIVFVNGVIDRARSDLGGEHEVVSLASALEADPECLSGYLGQGADYRRNGFELGAGTRSRAGEARSGRFLSN